MQVVVIDGRVWLRRLSETTLSAAEGSVEYDIISQSKPPGGALIRAPQIDKGT
jgi:hypothetical protein